MSARTSRLPAEQIIDTSAGLVDKSLVVVEPEVLGQARYRLLDSVRAYAAQRLAAAGEAAAIQLRFRDYAVRYTERAQAVGMAEIPAGWAEAVDVFRRYDVDAGNLRQVLSRCVTTGDAETGLRLCTAVRPCWIVRGHYAEGEEWFARFLALGHAGLPAPVLGAALIGRAQLIMPDDPATAQAWARQGLALCRAAGQLTWTATALNLLAEADLHAGRLDGAAECAAEALATARAAGNAWNEGYALGTQGALAAMAGQLREAGRLGEAALAVMRGIDQQWGVARTLLGLGALARLRGDPAGALDCYREALPDPARDRLAAGHRPLPGRDRPDRAGPGRPGPGPGAPGREPAAQPAHRVPDRDGPRPGGLRGARGPGGRGGPGRPAHRGRVGPARGGRAAAAGPAADPAAPRRGPQPRRGRGGRSCGGRARNSPRRPRWRWRWVPPPRRGTAGPSRRCAGSPPTPRSPRGNSRSPGSSPAGTATGPSPTSWSSAPATAARHVANILGKLGFSSRAQIAAWAAGNASIQPSSGP